MDSSALDMEQEKIISYLYTYGNTRKTDLITYGAQRLIKPEDRMRKLVDKMVLYGRLERVMHEELDPKVTYVKPGNMVPLELELRATAYSMDRGRLTEQEIEADKDILAKAEIVAERRVKRKFGTKLRKQC